ncbi:MAG: hypothetical protein APF81_16195 [Desulfosporosinus sp. BRH_c37]|nr:MAG: hypothetical protein APF81_16195 [Desulfosporosinus sp. BRH_c37]
MGAVIDQVTMQVVRYALEQIADEMGYTLVRTSRSTIIKEVMDITCAIFDAQGRTIAQAHHAPMLLTGFEITMVELIKRFPPGTLKEGDVVISNDPYLGGQHIMDIQTMAPVFFGGDLVGYVGAIAHQSDMGGAAPGGVAGGLTEIYQEGLRLPMVMLYKNFQENHEVFQILESNIRVPDKTLGDIRAQAACNFVGVRRLQEVFTKFGLEVVQQATNMLLDYSEKRMRESIRNLPDGTYFGEDFLDDDGITDDAIPIRVNVFKHDDVIDVNFDGTSPQVQGNINCPYATAMAAVYYTIIGVVDPHIPPNSGCYRPVNIKAELGTLVNPILPAGVAARTNTSQKVLEAMLKALSIALPEKVMAGSHAQMSTFAFSGNDPRHGGKRFVYTEVQGGGAGARPGKDAREAQDSHLARFMNSPIEAVELEYPVLAERYELIPDSCGAGKFRGSMGLRKDVRMLVDNVSFARYGDRQKFAPHGFFGGLPGSKGAFYLNPDTPEETRLKSKALSKLKLNDVVSARLPGGGGYGNPKERDPEMIKQDVINGKVSLTNAKEIYGWQPEN